MDEEFCMTVKDLVRNLRSAFKLFMWKEVAISALYIYRRISFQVLCCCWKLQNTRNKPSIYNQSKSIFFQKLLLTRPVMLYHLRPYISLFAVRSILQVGFFSPIFAWLTSWPCLIPNLFQNSDLTACLSFFWVMDVEAFNWTSVMSLSFLKYLKREYAFLGV